MSSSKDRKVVRRGSDIVRSARPGAISLSAKEAERAAWYADLQKEVFAKARADRMKMEDEGGVGAVDHLEDTKADEDEKEAEEDAELTETDEEIAEREAAEKAEAEAEQARKIQELLDKNRREAKKFSGGAAFALANESDAKAKEDEARREAIGKVRRPDPETFVRPKDFDPSLWIVRVGKELGKSAQARVLAIPWLCGDAAVFKDLAIVLNNENIELYSVQLPGRYVRLNEPYFKSVFQIVHHMYEALQELWMLDMDLPKLVIMGHSVGAIVGFELTLLIEKELYEGASSSGGGEEAYFGVKHLLVTSCNPPHVITKLNSDRFETKFFCASGGELWDRFALLGLAPVHLRGRKDMLGMYMPIFRADYALLEKYIYWQDAPEEEGGKKDKNKRASRLGAASGQTQVNYVLPMLRCAVTSMMSRDDPSTDVKKGHEWARHSTLKPVLASLVDPEEAKREKKLQKEKRKKAKTAIREKQERAQRKANGEEVTDDEASVSSHMTGMTGQSEQDTIGNETATATVEVTLSDSESESDNSSLDSRDSQTRARDRDRERRRIEAQGRPSNAYWKNLPEGTGGHMWIRNAVFKTYHDDLVDTLLDICYQ